MNLTAITMPCFGTTSRTRNNAHLLAQELGANLREINISQTVLSHFSDIGQSPETHDAAYENGQARERTQVLMDIANMQGGLVVGTGDLSELALGWATYNGDHMSMYGVNASIPKTLVRHLVTYCADTAETATLKSILYDILDTPVSPELLPAQNGDISQKTEELVGPYELHDFYLYYAVRWGFSPRKVLALAQYAFYGREEYSNEILLKWLKIFYRRFFSQQFKRSCLPDGPKVGSVTLSPVETGVCQATPAVRFGLKNWKNYNGRKSNSGRAAGFCRFTAKSTPPKPKGESKLSPLAWGAAARPAAGRRGAPTITFPTVIL